MKSMKKIVFMMIALFAVFAFVGCEGMNNNANKEIIITLIDEEGIELSAVEAKSGEETTLEAPDKEGYEFVGFYIDGEEIEMPYEFKEDTTVEVRYTVLKFNYSFYVDGELYSSNEGEYGAQIIFPENPTKDSNNEITYSFTGWDNDAKVLTKDEVFNAIFSEATVKYTLKYFVGDELYNEITVEYGSVITHPENPTKASTKEFTYEFIGWDNDVDTVTKDEVFNAIFKEEPRVYTYKFLDAKGDVIVSESNVYGTIIEYPEAPTKEATAEYTYEFIGWDSDVTVLVDNITFKPLFDSIKNQYTYRFLDENGKVLKEETVDYGTLPVAPSNPKKEGYKFIGWDKDISKVVMNIDYTAEYSEIVPVTSLEGLKVSILGDSISTFYAAGSEMNSYYSGTNQFYYPTYSATIKTVQSTWWYKLIKNNKMELGINNSWSGSCAYGTNSSAGQHDDRINTIDENGMPDVVIIYLGTNDCASGYATEDFISAIETMIEKIRNIGNPDIFITTLGYSAYKGSSYSEERRVSYNEALRNVALERDCGIIPLDDYIVDNSYMFYLGDNLHYNAKGAELLSKIYEKAIKEYYGIEYTDEIVVEYKEKLPEGVTGKITATSNSNYWGGYASNVYLVPQSFTNPQFSHRIEMTLGEDGKYYVTKIMKSGENNKFTGDLIIIISEAHNDSKSLVDAVSNVQVGNVVEFDTNMNFPVEVIFKVSSDAPTVNPTPDPEPTPDPGIEGALYVGAYNEGVWSKNETTVIAYSDDKMDKVSTYINFYVISLTKDETSENYVVSALKTVGDTMTFTSASYYILIYSSLSQKSFYENAEVGQVVEIVGDITSGSANLIFK